MTHEGLWSQLAALDGAKTAGSQMPLDALHAAVKLAVDALVKNFS